MQRPNEENMNRSPQIRTALPSDLRAIQEIFARARRFMQQSGNPNQWESGYPSDTLILHDIVEQNCYAIASGATVYGVFSLIAGADPTYAEINGEWLNDEPYAALHRVAASGESSGIFSAAAAYAKTRHDNLRIDTHRDNKIMQHLISKHGFRFCGIITIEKNNVQGNKTSARLAYQWSRTAD